jgi:hypothetical protein
MIILIQTPFMLQLTKTRYVNNQVIRVGKWVHYYKKNVCD